MKFSPLILLFLLFHISCNQSSAKQHKELYDFIKSERKIVRIYENPELIDLNFIDNLDKLDISNYKKTKENSILNYWSNKKLIISNKKAENYRQNISEFREDSAYFNISYPIFYKNYSKAIVEITYECGRYCSYNETCTYLRGFQGWRLEKTIQRSEW